MDTTKPADIPKAAAPARSGKPLTTADRSKSLAVLPLNKTPQRRATDRAGIKRFVV